MNQMREMNLDSFFKCISLGYFGTESNFFSMCNIGYSVASGGVILHITKNVCFDAALIFGCLLDSQ